MKHLKKYNESKEDMEYLHQIFADLIEDYDARYVEIPEEYDYHSYYEILIPEPNMKNAPRQDGVDKSLEEYLDSYIEKSQNMVKLCNEVKSCIGRIKDAFPNARVEYNIIASDALPYLSSRTIRIEVYNL